MGSGRARAAAVAALLAAAALTTGCGESRHANKPRPQVSTRVSVTINRGEVIVQPTRIAFGPERDKRIPQNQNHPQPPIKTTKPLDVVFVAANQTEANTKLRIRGDKEAESGTIYARGPATYGVALPAGAYTISAAGMPGAKPGHLVVGRYRGSSKNDVLLP